jgi:hypothetical protein
MADNYNLALTLARMGFPVFPCRVDKRPATAHGFKDATTDPAHLARYWQAEPRYLVGLPTGAASGLLVIDLDIDRDTGGPVGEATAAAKGWGFLLTIPHVLTPSGGRHVLFRHAEGLGNSAGKLGRKIDTRGDGGYIIAPGTVTPSGRYAPSPDLDLARLPDLPAVLMEALKPSPSAPPQPMTQRPALSGDRAAKWGGAVLWAELVEVTRAPAGTRNDRLNRAAFAVARASVAGRISCDWAFQQLEAAALSAGLTITETRATIASGWAKGLLSPRAPKENRT